ncbi:MAG TPA: hypothetical protein VN823_11380 [Stellaceae bacterium]|nr:hypothetical protein [Stellaceae bacterium]
MRAKAAISTLIVAGLGLALSACYVAPAPGYGYYDSGYYGSPGYYGPAYYGPSVGVYYGGGGGWGGGGWGHDHRWR